MHNTTARFNSIMMFAGIVLAISCALNFVQGRYFQADEEKVRVSMKINQPAVMFADTSRY